METATFSLSGSKSTIRRNKENYEPEQALAMGTFQKTVKSSRWVVLGSVTNKLIGVVSFFILARLLDPESFGLIAIILIVVGLFDRFFVTGFESALIQRKGEVEKYFDAVWSFNIIKSVLLFVAVYVAAPYIADYFHAQSATQYIRWSGIFTVVNALGNIYQLNLFRDFSFNILYARNVSGQVAYVLVGVLWAAVIAADVSALFFAHLAKYVASLIVLYVYLPKLPRFTHHMGVLKELVAYSKWISAQNVINYLVSIVDNVIIGRLLNPAILGFYTRARNLATTTLTPIATALKELGFVAFSKVQDNTEKLRTGFYMTFDLVLLVGLTNLFVIWLAGETLTLLLIGEQWLGIVPALKIFSVYAISSAIGYVAYLLFDGAGKPDISLKAKLMSLVLYALLSYIGIIYKGMAGAALGITVSNIIVLIYVLHKLHTDFQLSINLLMARTLMVVAPLAIASLIFLPYFMLYVTAATLASVYALMTFYVTFLLLFWLVGRRYDYGCLRTLQYFIMTLRVRNK